MYFKQMATTFRQLPFLFPMKQNFYFFRRINWWLEQARILLFRRKITSRELGILEKEFRFFGKLDTQHRREFLKKMEIILSSKRFIGSGGIVDVTPEMEILISATISMVTLGWKRLRLAHFNTILIYPNVYYSSSQKIYHRGEVNPKKGQIVVSWQSFLEGYKNENDGINLGIHEVAHALKLANQIDTDGEKEFDTQAWKEYKSIIPAEMEKVKSGQDAFFRKSAGLNEHEFFAVALESFFERPWEFFRERQEFYLVLVRLMRQDPRVWSSQGES